MSKIFLPVVWSLALCMTTAIADDSAKNLKNIVALGPGVHEIQKDKQGRIISCIIVGQARISEVLGASKGLQTARQKADLVASGEFVKWLNEEVKVIQSSEDETIILLEGNGNGEDNSVTESGKAVEKNSVKMQSISQGFVKGLQLIYTDVDSDNKTFTVAKGWSLKNSKAVSAIEDGSYNQDQSLPKKSNDKKIKSKSVISKDANQFLRKD